MFREFGGFALCAWRGGRRSWTWIWNDLLLRRGCCVTGFLSRQIKRWEGYGTRVHERRGGHGTQGCSDSDSVELVALGHCESLTGGDSLDFGLDSGDVGGVHSLISLKISSYPVVSISVAQVVSVDRTCISSGNDASGDPLSDIDEVTVVQASSQSC